MVNITNQTFQNISIPQIRPTYNIITTRHGIGLVELILAVVGYIILVYFYVKVNKEPEKYRDWVNPKGRHINVIKLLRYYMYLYPIVVIVLGALEILIFRG